MKLSLRCALLLALCLYSLQPHLVRAEPPPSPLLKAWIEPLIGFSTSGELKVSHQGLGQTQSYFSGIGLGSRLGVFWKQTLFLALDFNYFPALIQAESHGSPWTNTLLGLTLGARLPNIPMRFWIGYSFINHISPSQFLNPLGITSPTALDGGSFKIGSSLEVLKGYLFNAELHLGSFHRYSSGASESISLPSGVAASHTSLFFSLSKLIEI